MSIESEMAQNQFLQMGGIYARALAVKQKSGELAKVYVYQEYPRVLSFDEGEEEIERSTETIKGTTVTWVQKRRKIREVIVHSEEEEERVMSGGKTSPQLEEERQELILRCRTLGLKVDPSWSSVRLRRELGDKLDAPEPRDEMAAMKAKLAQLEEMDAMRQRIADLEAKLTRPTDEAQDIRQQLEALGVVVDRRWGVQRLRDELEAATAPNQQVA